jgi:colanic acid biosynthesis glycosyl transferase WcaI
MHLVLLNQYYPPDAAPTGVMLEAVAEALAAQGHQVTVVCAGGGYAATASNEAPDSRGPRHSASADAPTLRVLRLGATRFGRATFSGKLLDYFSFYLGVGWKLARLRPRPDRVVALTTPPYLSVLARIGSKLRGADHAHWVMDLYPDVMVAHGMLREGGLGQRLLAGLAAFGFGGRRCAAVVTLGPDMAARVTTHLRAGARPVAWVPLWGSEEEGAEMESPTHQPRTTPDGSPPASPSSALRQRRGWAGHETVVMYSGNMGLGHRFQEILEAARQLADQPVSTGGNPDGPPRFRFVFFGRGKRRAEVENFLRAHPECPVELHDYAPAGELAAHLRTADVHLASLASEWTGTMVPSKLQGIFAAGRPVVFIGSAASSIGSWINESGGGWVVEPGDLTALLSALQEAADPAQRATRGQQARAFAALHFDRQQNARQIAALLAGGGRD